MIFLPPIVERELRVATRLRATYWLRVVAALVGILIGSGMLVISLIPMMGSGQAGGPVFAILTWLCLAGVWSAGLFFTSDCLSFEKREGTLGFLFLTNLRGYDVVFGKLFATSLRCVFALLAVFPVLALTQLLGGVEVGEFWRTLLALVNMLFFSLSAGLLMSAVSRESQRALLATLTLLVAAVALGPMTDGLVHVVGGKSGAVFSWTSPGFAFTSAKRAPTFWPALATSHALAWLMLGLASGLVRRMWQEKPGRTSAQALQRRYSWRYGGAQRRRRLREKLLDRNPVLWLAVREWGQGIWLWALGGLFIGVFVFSLWIDAPAIWWSGWSGFNTTIWLVLYLWIAARSCQFFAEARRNGMIELLLAAPMNSQDIVRGAGLALLRTYVPPVLVLLCGQFAVSWLASASGRGISGAPGLEWYGLLGAVGSFVTTLANLIVLGWFGLWMGLISKSTPMALLKTLLFVQVIPWMAAIFLTGAVMLGLTVSGGLAFMSTSSTSMIIMMPYLFVVLPVLFALAKNIFLFMLAKRRMYDGFRQVAVNSIIPVQAAGVPPQIPLAR